MDLIEDCQFLKNQEVSHVKRPSIDCRKKSSVAPILENFTIKSDKITDSQLRNFAADALHSHNLFSDLSLITYQGKVMVVVLKLLSGSIV